MASSEPVHPLRISKTPSGSPTKMATGIPRPLSEISPSEKRRNSPSWNQVSKKVTLDSGSSPFQSSPVEGGGKTSSPRLFWQSRNTTSENSLYGGGSTRSGSPSPMRRSSIERLHKASRVKNSNILALEQKQEYDPTRIPHIERPLAKVQGNSFMGSPSANSMPREGAAPPGSSGPERRFHHGHQRSQSKTDIPLYSPTKSSAPMFAAAAPSTPGARPKTPTKDGSPIKSSLAPSRFKSSFDEQTGIWTTEANGDEDGLKSLHKHNKSVTFDAAPPQVNEYEMATPDLSSVGSNSREGSYESEEDGYNPAYPHHDVDGQDDSFDASLEDTDKTPVVGPDDWTRGGPSRGDDPFYDSSPAPDGLPQSASSGRPPHQRTDSSNSDHRPLPPLPGMDGRPLSRGSPGLSATAERMLGSQRNLPSPPAAQASKSEIQSIGNARMPLEERLKLMMLSDDGKAARSAAELQQRERRMRRAGARDCVGSPAADSEADSATAAAPHNVEEEDTVGDLSGLGEYQLPPRISRESILRRVNGNKTTDRESDYRFSSPGAPSPSPERTLALDPDVPIPSTEHDSFVDEEDDDGSVIVRRDLDNHDDIDSITDMYQNDDQERLGSNDGDNNELDDCVSNYSDDAEPVSKLKAESDAADADNSTDTITSSKGLNAPVLPRPDDIHGHSMADAHEYLQRPFTPDQPLSKPEYDGSGWGEPDEYDDDEPGTPDSVIHHPISDDEETYESPAIPERIATIKASGSRLKTRASATPSDLMAMREARRHVSREAPVPPIPERHRNRLSRDFDADYDIDLGSSTDEYIERHPSFKKRSLTLDLDLGLSLDQDFERVIEAQKVAYTHAAPKQAYNASGTPSRQVPAGKQEATTHDRSKDPEASDNTNDAAKQKRGYLMRQNTKLVAASDKDNEDRWKARSAGNSPVKTDRPQSWTVEPWNGKVRPRSVRKRAAPGGHVPPMPGQESNATALNPLTEEDINAEFATEESGERGRLFVKVMGVKDLDLPIPRTERTWFSLTLDNGVHCVTTAWLELARNAPIGQEFELVVPNDLEFQLTLNVKLEKPVARTSASSSSPVKPHKTKTSTFSRVFASPKKRREMEMRQREEEERYAQQQREEAARQQMNQAPGAYELLSRLVAEDGSFARAYVCLKEHEPRCFGRPYLAEIACFNEWATEEAAFASSVKSKRGHNSSVNGGPQAVARRAPYKIGKLELQLLFVPRPKSSTDEEMPKSMNSCIRELKAAEERASRNWEGHLSQQGGDCPYWRRRYFKLVGTKLTAYHEATRQPRATINLGNAKRFIDDRRALTEKETTGKGGKRRRSAFAEEEEGYMFVEEGFRIRFNNGEVIDFYADTAEDKEGWMRVLSDIIGGRVSDGGLDDDVTGAPRRSKWCDLVLKREEAIRRRAEGRRVHSRTKSMYV